jgi:diguanylate cyclase (GGDEF)-like protein
LFFGGHNGFNAFQPENVQANSSIPLIMLTGFFNTKDPIKSDLPIDDNEGIEIGYNEDTVSFEFAALDFTSPADNQYMYKLEGFDKEWIELGNRRRITYTDLADGQYLLRVRAANSDGVWNNAGMSLPVRVIPAPWDTWWAYLGYVAMFAQLIVLLWLGHKRKIQREEEYSARLELEVKKRTAELAERNNDLKQLNVTLQESSLSDPLTGLRNRRFVFDEVSRDLDVIRRKYDDEQSGLDPRDAADLVFMMIDLDNFKPINDTYGHAAGDQMLLDVRDVLLSTCRRSDHVIRWGGDEFVVIAKQANPGETEALAERIRTRIAEHNFMLGDGQMVRITCSIGFAAFPIFRAQADSATLEQVINMADNLMYEAKRERNSWAGVLGLSAAATSENFDRDSIEPTSLLFRALREGNLAEHRSGGDDRELPCRLSAVS